jgi:hypothetical protein
MWAKGVASRNQWHGTSYGPVLHAPAPMCSEHNRFGLISMTRLFCCPPSCPHQHSPDDHTPRQPASPHDAVRQLLPNGGGNTCAQIRAAAMDGSVGQRRSQGKQQCTTRCRHRFRRACGIARNRKPNGADHRPACTHAGGVFCSIHPSRGVHTFGAYGPWPRSTGNRSSTLFHTERGAATRSVMALRARPRTAGRDGDTATRCGEVRAKRDLRWCDLRRPGHPCRRRDEDIWSA